MDNILLLLAGLVAFFMVLGFFQLLGDYALPTLWFMSLVGLLARYGYLKFGKKKK
jgi:hypothetical protein